MQSKYLKILLVDDDDDDREFFADALQELNMQTELKGFFNGRDCIEHLSNCDDFPNLLFLDLNMPIMNGMECLELIRKDKRLSNLTIAIYSTSSTDRDVEATFSKGANIYLKKPSCFNDLKTSLKEVLQMSWAYHTSKSHCKNENFLLRL